MTTKCPSCGESCAHGFCGNREKVLPPADASNGEREDNEVLSDLVADLEAGVARLTQENGLLRRTIEMLTNEIARGRE